LNILKPKVLFVIDTLETGGAEQSLLDNVSRFRSILPVVCHLYTGDTLKQQFLHRGIPVHSVNLKRKYGFLPACKQLQKIVKEQQPDLLVAYLTRSELVTRMVGRWQRIPVIGTFVSDLYSPEYNRNLSATAKIAVRFFRLLNKTTGRLCAGFIANSETIKMANARRLGIATKKIEVINRGRDSKVFTWRSREIVPEKPIGFLNTGRLVPVKGQRDLILAFASFVSVFPHAVLHIAGDGPCRNVLQQMIEELRLDNKVTLLGTRTDLPTLIHNYDCFVFPSLSEGFSGSLVEAMLCGLPVLASDIPVNREVIRHLETGYLFNSGSPVDILEALLWFRDNRAVAATMATTAHAYALEHFELEKQAARLENYLHTKMTAQQ
jgi:glycosyltransferase involved in cell wall biosynthesis